MNKLLLHVCCAPCSPYVVDRLRGDYAITLYFYNPNIHPVDEYFLRFEQLRSWAEREGLPLVAEEYGAGDWFEAVRGLENEPERGARCGVCFELRLSRAAAKASELGFDAFGTVLTVSPHKEAAVINSVGAKAGVKEGVEYLVSDWKKKEGFKITSRMSRELGFERQDYCGCVYSMKDRAIRRAAPKRPTRPPGPDG
ncbi:MAG: epoxyqueuosine reductase QueH [Candidatus Nitrospinota bacterium M3_3B_026]